MSKVKVYEILENNNIPYKRFFFEGHCIGTSNSFPEKTGEYNTVRYGWLEKYTKGSNVIGNWIKVYEDYIPGDAYSPSEYVTYYVPIEYQKKAIELLIKNGKKYIVEVATPDMKKEKERIKKIIKDRLDTLKIDKLTKILEIIQD